jgi:hypothetical protein
MAAPTLWRLAAIPLLLVLAGCASDAERRHPSQNAWWQPDVESGDRSFFYGSFFGDGR